MKLLECYINITAKLKGENMTDSKKFCNLSDGWAIYGGADGVTHYIRLCSVIGLKVTETEVTLRLSNGQFVTTTDPLAKVLADLATTDCCY